MSRIYSVQWSETGLIELAKMYPYPLNIKEKIYKDSLKRLSFLPALLAKQIPFGEWEGYWARPGLYQAIIIYQIDDNNMNVWIDAVKHKRQNLYFKVK